MKAISYLRCSGESQIHGDTWARQQEAISKWAAASGVEVVREFRDEGITGKMELENREGLSACIHFAQSEGIKLVLVEDSTRLARDMIVAEVIVREFQKLKIRVVSACGNVDLTAGDDSNPTAKLVRQILSAVAEFDRCVISLKLRGAKDRKRSTDPNWREGRRPYGMLDGEQEQIAVMRFMRSQGAKIAAIRDALTAQGKMARSGKPWTTGALHRILKRA